MARLSPASGNIGDMHFMFAHHAGEMAADHGCAFGY